MHHPKGEMCIACKHRDRKCSHLDFRSMRVMGRYTQDGKKFFVVKCAEFRKSG